MLLRESRLAAGSGSGQRRRLTILDACTGTGCIALLLYAQLRRRALGREKGSLLHVVGLDLAPEAVSLARENAARNRLLPPDNENVSTSVRFVQGDLFSDDWLKDPAVQHLLLQSPLDVLVSNPPYISADGFAHDTARSVRLFEPKLAQVPDTEAAVGSDMGTPDRGHPEDVFYVRLLALAARLDARILLCETGGLEQAKRVVALALEEEHHPSLVDIEIWADQPDIMDVDSPERCVTVAGREVRIKGSGHGRSVFIRRR